MKTLTQGNRSPLIAFAMVIAGACIVLAIAFAQPHRAVSQVVISGPITGFAWSGGADCGGATPCTTPEEAGGIGWISLNCTTGGSSGGNICVTSNYGLSIDGSGNITGYAWSDNIGWISANHADVAYCETTYGGGDPQLQSGTLTGWLRALSGAEAQNGGWDGCISLSGANYGVTETNGKFSGDAWGGSEDVGWIDFSDASGSCAPSQTYICSGPGNDTITEVTTDASCNTTQTPITSCSSPKICNTGSSACEYPTPIVGPFTALPAVVVASSTATVAWNVQDVQSCTVSGSNNDGTTTSSDTNSPGVWSGLSGSMTTSPIYNEVVYTLTCVPYDPNQSSVTETATVGIVPKYEER